MSSIKNLFYSIKNKKSTFKVQKYSRKRDILTANFTETIVELRLGCQIKEAMSVANNQLRVKCCHCWLQLDIMCTLLLWRWKLHLLY